MNSMLQFYIHCSWKTEQQIETVPERKQSDPSRKQSLPKRKCSSPLPNSLERSQSVVSVPMDSVNEKFSSLLTQGGSNKGAPDCSRVLRSPQSTRSPTGSMASSRRQSFMFFMGMSTDSGKRLIPRMLCSSYKCS